MLTLGRRADHRELPPSDRRPSHLPVATVL